ncbi:DUF4055 domain-containing protein [Rhizobium sp. LC145]|uniref:DUF4055 domain-containing protein n=1 Tax=Rhizobium sp. LC145 TaxID=1120688 RepID=UPI000629FBCB|nr:DUF4055 domain-containing protein [Rhizobium sp. LC145]KKX25306.1 hypothetical protein YH62_25495 [Rhizobium sp. LC145]TKT45328.1 DUF4055 domain-containing protein [Rhizobiaceae bacterium LC148]
MAFDPTLKHPLYEAFCPSWRLMRDCMDGEDAIKQRGEAYLPMKSGTRAIDDPAKRQAAYDAYKLRAEFPELVAPTVRGSTGTILDKPAVIELPAGMEPLREKATRDGLTLDALHRRIALELLVTGRYGILPGISSGGAPYLAGYIAESIVNWDSSTNGEPDYVVLDESGLVLNRDKNAWEEKCQFRQCLMEGGRFVSRVWTETSAKWEPSEDVVALDRKQRPLAAFPFVFINANDLSPTPDDVPLYGLGKLAVRIYRLDADYVFALHMTSEPTPVAIGFDDPASAVKEGRAPTTLGSSKLWLLPVGGDAKYLEFSGPGLDAQKQAIQDALARAVVFGAQILIDTAKTAESGEARRLRLGNQTSTLKTIAMNSASGLERALKNLARWIGEDPEKVKVTPNLDFFDRSLTGQELTAIVSGWQSGAYSWRSAFDRLQKGGIIPDGRTPEEELEMMDQDEFDRDGSEERAAMNLPSNSAAE